MVVHIFKNNKQMGPYEDSVVADSLRSGAFLPTDLACYEGSKEWVPLSTLFPSETPAQSISNPQQGARHDIPKCLSCGAITPWKLDPIINTHHIIVSLVLMLLFCSGIAYFITIFLMRSNPNMRAKVCPRCGARNMWSFQY